jgi:hypothetical protein
MPAQKSPFPDLHRTVRLSGAACLDIVEYLARQCRSYGIDADLLVSHPVTQGVHAVGRSAKAPGPHGYERHYILCRCGDSTDWVMQLLLADLGDGCTVVALGVSRYRESRRGIVGGKAAHGFIRLVAGALERADAPVVTGPASNVVPLRRYAPLSA